MSDDNHKEEKQVLSAKSNSRRVCDSEIRGKRHPLGPLEAMDFAKQYIQHLNTKAND